MLERAMFVVGGAVLAMAIAPSVVAHALAWGLVDQPSERSVHTRVVPRTGGLLLLIAFTVAWIVLGVLHPPDRSWLVFGLGGFMAWGVGFADDRVRMGAGRKFVLQVLLAALVVILGLRWGGHGKSLFGAISFGGATPS